MKSFRTPIVVATAAFALSLAGVSRAEDDVNSKKGTTTQTPTTTTTGTSSSTTDTDVPVTTTDTTGAAPSDTPTPTTPSTSTDTTFGTGSDSAYGTGYGTAQPYQPYQQAQQQPAQQETTTYSTTTTTAGTYNANYNPNAGAEHDGWIHRPNRPLLYTGLGILVGTYATSVVVGASSDKDVDKRLYIPVAGPWLDLGQRECGLGECGQTENWNQALLIGSGVLQGVGTILTVSSFFAREENVSPPSASTARARSTAAAKPKVHLTPMNMRGGGGFGAIGTF